MDSNRRFRQAIERLSLAGLLVDAPPEEVVPSSLADDSRRIEPGGWFLALPGTRTNGHAYVAEAYRRGAVLALVEHPTGTGIAEVRVRDARLAARLVAAAWHGHPAERMRLVGVTGTNGKTTTATLTAHLLNADHDAGLIGTLGAFDGRGGLVPSTAGVLTTPGPVDLQATFEVLDQRGVRQVAMEASSHSLEQDRLAGLAFEVGVFTNLTRDHLDYHGTMEAYLQAKLRLADQVGGACVANGEDPAWQALRAAGGRVLIWFGRGPEADVRAEAICLEALGSRFRLAGRFGRGEVTLPLPGEFNVLNALGAAAAALWLGVPLPVVRERLEAAPQVPGRMERLATAPCTVLRDYAHTPDALERVLRTLRPLTGGRLIVLFGCGGDRDRGKRPLMGRIAAELADLAVVTSDNPRTEDPERILDDIVAAMPPGYVRLTDRRAAIARAVELARPGDTLLLAGKGHETYQIVGTEKHPFDERAILRELTGAGGAG